MIIDIDTQFANAVSVANAAGSTLIGSQIDTAVAGTMDGTNIGLVIVVTTAITAATAGLLRFQLASGASAAIPVDGTATVLYQTGDFVTGTTAIPAGTVLFAASVPRQSGIYNNNKRFLGLIEVVTTAAVAAGAVSAFLVADVGRYASLPVAAN
jgi:hypothetical protein